MPRHVLFLRLAYQAGMCLLALVAVTLTAIDLTTEAAVMGSHGGPHHLLDFCAGLCDPLLHQPVQMALR